MSTPKILYEDDSILVLDKPAGWVVNDAKTAHGNPIIQNWIGNNFNFPLSGDVEMRGGIVHRLDKDTSGILLIGKTRKAFESLQDQFKERTVKKSYFALVHGNVKNDSGTISEPVGRLPWNRERFGVLPAGKPSETYYELKDRYKDPNGNSCTLLKATPKTGRTHQIRVHLKHIGHPIVSDSFYAGRKTSRKDKLWCSRLFLHSGEITFTHPTEGKIMNLSCPLPKDLRQCLDCLIMINIPSRN